MSFYDSFKSKWNGKRVDYDKIYGYQCVDLIKQYLNEGYGLKPGAWGDAIHYWTRTRAEVLAKFDKVAGSDAVKGDIVIFYGVNSSPYGHIGVATGNTDSKTVEVLEQNGATGDGDGLNGDQIRTRAITRSRVAGILRPKQTWLVNHTVVGKTVYLNKRVSSWRVYRKGTRTVVATLNPSKFGGLSYKIEGVDSLPQRVLIRTELFGLVSLPVDKDAEIR